MADCLRPHVHEREFHDAWADTIDPRSVPVFGSFTASTAPEARWLLEEIGELRGRRVLELGSGAGEGQYILLCAGRMFSPVICRPECWN